LKKATNLSKTLTRKLAMKEKKFKPLESIKTLVKNKGSCIASDHITVEGLQVGYMFRSEPEFDTDSGWRFFSGKEDQDYVDNPDNMMIYHINTIANYDPSIVPYLELDIGSQLERNAEGRFNLIA
jgi:hypothetical protein